MKAFNIKHPIVKRIYKYKSFYLIFLPVFLFYFVFCYIPMYGAKMAFWEYGLFGPTKYIGFDNFYRLFQSKDFITSFKNTLLISGINLVIGMFLSIIFALLLNEVRNIAFKKLVQTVVFLPYFFSWVVVAAVFTLILSPDYGFVNAIIEGLGGEKFNFLINEKAWMWVFIAISRWKETGYAIVIYIAALSNIDPTLYEASSIDGANRLKQTFNITIPSLMPTILTILILESAKILNIFEPILVLQNPLVYQVSDVIGTYTYRVGLVQGDYAYAAAVGLFKSVMSLILVIIANSLSKRVRNSSVL